MPPGTAYSRLSGALPARGQARLAKDSSCGRSGLDSSRAAVDYHPGGGRHPFDIFAESLREELAAGDV